MTRKSLSILAIAVVVVGAGVAWLTLGDAGKATAGILFDPNDQEVVLLGELLYAEHCASCHGANLEGQENWKERKPDGRMPAPPHDMSGHTWHHPEEQLFLLTKRGPARLIGNGYQSDMPGYAEILSDAQIVAVLSYIKSTWPEDVQARHTEMSRQ